MTDRTALTTTMYADERYGYVHIEATPFPAAKVVVRADLYDIDRNGWDLQIVFKHAERMGTERARYHLIVLTEALRIAEFLGDRFAEGKGMIEAIAELKAKEEV